VGDAVQQMDQATQQNAALVEQSAAAAASLKQQAQELVDAVAVFRVHGGSSHGGKAHARPASAQPAPRALASPRSTAALRPASATPLARAPASAGAVGWDGTERRGPDRATNVTRLTARPAAAPKVADAAPAAARTGSDDDWETF